MESKFGDISRPRILIVEDQRVTAEKLRMDLEHLGYEVCGIVPKGKEVFQKAQDTRPDIAVMDIKLQGEVDGIEAAQDIRMRLNIPIVFLSAYSDQSVVERARIAQPYGYIVKPYRVEELHAAVEIALFKHKADTRIRETEQRLELALMGADLGLWDYNLKTGEAFSNKRRAEMVGYSVDELEPRMSSWGKLVHPDDIDRVINAFNAHVEGRTPLYESEHRVRHKSGDYIWVLSRAKVVEWDEQGYPVRIVGTNLDITDRKRAEEALRKSEGQYKTLVETMGESVVRIDENGMVKFVNDSFCEVSGYSRDEIIGRFLTDFPTQVDQELIREQMELRRQGIGGSYETVLTTKDGQEKHAIVSSRPILEDGDVFKGTFIVGLDITERKRMEEALLESRQRLELALEGAGLGLWDWNIQTGEMIFNKRGAEILGTSLDELEPHFWSWSKRVHPDDRRRLREDFTAHLEGRTPYFERQRTGCSASPENGFGICQGAKSSNVTKRASRCEWSASTATSRNKRERTRP